MHIKMHPFPALCAIAMAVCCGNSTVWAQAQVTTLSEISVRGERHAGYRPDNTRSATRTDTALKDIPQSISVITKDMMADIGDGDIRTALELGGVGRGNVYAGGIASYNLRGFRSSVYYRNGMASTGFGGVADTSGVESLDILRGPSSTTFGASDPGGTFNVVSKPPLADAAYAAGFVLDSHGGYRGTMDLSGPLNHNGAAAYRLNLAQNDGNTFRDHIRIQRSYVAPRLSWQLAPNTTLFADVEWLRVKMPFDRGIPISPNLLYGLPSVAFFPSEPSIGDIINTNTTGQLRLTHTFSGPWALDAGVQRVVGSMRGLGIQPSRVLADGRTLVRSISMRENLWNSNLAQVYARGRQQWGGIPHQLLLGAEYIQSFGRQDHRAGLGDDPMPLDIYDPVYGAVELPTQFRERDPRRGNHEHTRALVAQDQIRLNAQWGVLAALRHDRYDNRSATSSTRNTATTPRLGINYEINPNTTGYISHARSFKPNTGTDVDANPFAPERGVSWEAGLKLEAFRGRLHLTPALFHIVKNNVLTSDPDNPDYSITTGQVRSQGADLSLNGLLGEHTRLVGYLAFVDAKVTKDTRLVPGARIGDVPLRRAQVMLMHRFSGPLHKLEAGASVRYVDGRVTSSAANALHMASYSTLDMMGNYHFSPRLRLKITMKNVLDRKYIEYNHNISGFPGLPRTLQVSLETQL